ncbi:hypothetical protein F4V43_06425 [Paenibacillus spiritus]|uniref:Uncharacterized protein n=1 Tax=Paenibacillus spiritus TaxID=2496557 RepID=A0A5J5GGD0_9BACL|nr:ABC transporter permease subunit [Paenibacillus spiritus]KAA9006574.1 hypothetical protein F4V43_06425 [Paenibacillus spiritus]
MLKLIRYELFKVSRKRLIWLVLPFFLLSNGFLYYNQQTKADDYLLQHMNQYREWEQRYQGGSSEETLARMSRVQQELSDFGTLVVYRVNLETQGYQELLRSFIQDHPDLVERFDKSPYSKDPDQFRADLFTSNLLFSQYQNMQGYKEYVSGIQDRADELLTVSVFQKKGSFAYRNILKTAADFKHLEGIPLKSGLENGIVSGTQYSTTDLFMGVVLFLLCIYIFLQEKESGLLKLIRTSKNGRFPVIAAKLAALTLLSAAAAAVFYSSILLIAYSLYGFGDMSRYVQSMLPFKYSDLLLTVREYLLYFVLLKVAASTLLALLFAVVFVALHHAGKIYLTLALLLVSSYLAKVAIHPLSSLGFFKYMNPVSYYDTFSLLGVYHNLNIGGHPVNRLPLSLLGIAVLILALPAASVAVYIKQNIASLQPSPNRWWQLFITRIRSKRGSNRLFVHESYKALITGRGLLYMVIALIVGFYTVNLEEVRFDQDDSFYNLYLKQLAGPLTPEKAQFIEAEKGRFRNLPVEMADNESAFSSHKISYHQYSLKKSELEVFQLKSKAFERVAQQYSHLAQLQTSRHLTGSFVNEISSNYLFQNRFRDQMVGIVYSSLLLLTLTPLFTMDYKNGMVSVIRSTRKGRFSLYGSKHLIAYLLAIGMLAILSAPRFLNLIHGYAPLDWDAPIQSLKLYGNLGLSVSIREFVIVTAMLQLWGILLLVQVALALSVLLKRHSLALLLTLALGVIPLVIQSAGLDSIQAFSFNGVHLLYFQLADHSFSYTLGYLGVLTCAGLLLSWVSWGSYKGYSISWRLERIRNETLHS